MERFSELFNEVMKFNNFYYPDEVRNAVQEFSGKNIDRNQVDLSEDSQFIKAVSSILENKKCSKASIRLIGSMSSLILSNEMPLKSLTKLLKSLNVYSGYAESDINLKLLQFYSTLLPNYMCEVDVLQVIFSNSLGMIANQTKIVAATAYATSLQMISLFINNIQNTKYALSEQEREKICCLCKYDFDKNLYAIVYLILHDISAILLSDKLLWLNLPEINRKIVFGLWGNIIKTNKNLICHQKYLLELVESSVILPIVNLYETKFLIIFLNNFMEVLKEMSITIFSYFISSCNFENQGFFNSLYFFRMLFLNNDHFIISFLESCDEIINLIDVLFENLVKIEKKFSNQPIQIFKNINFKNLNKELFYRNAPIEICLKIISVMFNESQFNADKKKRRQSLVIIKSKPSFYLSSFSQSKDSIQSLLDDTINPPEQIQNSTENNVNSLFLVKNTCITEFVLKTYNNIVTIISDAFIAANQEQYKYIFDYFESLFYIFSFFKVYDGEKLIIDFLHKVAFKKITFDSFSKEKRHLIINFFNSILSKNPHLLHKYFYEIFNIFSSFKKNYANIEFTKDINNDDLEELSIALSNGNSYCISALSDILEINVDRFGNILSFIQKNIFEKLISPETQEPSFQFLIKISTFCFTAENSILILKLFYSLLGLLIPDKYYSQILNQIRYIIKNKSLYIKNGWDIIFDSLKIEHFQNINQEILINAFSLITTITNDFTYYISEDNFQTLLNLIFDYSFQTIDINVALSSLGFLWVIVSFSNKIPNFWKTFIDKIIILFNDKRNDVSTCAVRNLFSLISSNIHQLSTEIYEHLVKNILIPYLSSMNDFPEVMWNTQQLSLQEICHCVLSYYSYFENIPEFKTNFWFLFFEKQELFLLNCNNQEINVNAFQVFEELYPCQIIDSQQRKILLKSIQKCIYHFLKNKQPKSLVLSSLGRFTYKLLTTNTSIINSDLLEIWIEIISNICKNLQIAVGFINMSVQKSIDSLIYLINISDEITEQIFKGYVQIVVESEQVCVREEIIQKLITISKTDINHSHYFSLTKPIISIKESYPLIMFYIEHEYVSDFDILFDVLMELLDNEKYSEKSSLKIIEILPKLSTNSYLFINRMPTSIQVLQSLWLYFNPDSNLYNPNIFKSCFPVLKARLPLFIEAYRTDEYGLCNLLTFLHKSKVQPKETPGSDSNQCWHLFFILDDVYDLLNDLRPNVRALAKSIITSVSESLTSVL